MIKERNFWPMVIENLLDVFSLRVLIIPVGVLLSISVAHPSEAMAVMLKLLSSTRAWVIFLGIFVADAFIRAAYWYSYERSPRYKRRQEELERWQAEKALKASGYVAPKPDLITYLHDMRADKLAKRLPLEVVLTKELEEYWQASGTEQTFAAWAAAQWEEVCRAKQDSP